MRQKGKRKCNKIARGTLEEIAGLVFCFEVFCCEFWVLELKMTNAFVCVTVSVVSLQHLRRASFLEEDGF